MEIEKSKNSNPKNFIEKDELESDNYIPSIRANIYKYMEEKNLTIKQFIEETNLPMSSLNNLLYGNLKDCKLSTAISIAKAIGISVDELTNAKTINGITLQNIITCRGLPQNSIYLVRWFINHQATLYKQDKRNKKKIISVLSPIHTNNELLKVNNNFRQVNISHLPNELTTRVFFGLILGSDYYMPYYTPHDILLLANDRLPLPREHVVLVVKNNIFLAKQRRDGGVTKFYGIRDDKYRCDDSEVDEIIGYVAYVIPDTSEAGDR